MGHDTMQGARSRALSLFLLSHHLNPAGTLSVLSHLQACTGLFLGWHSSAFPALATLCCVLFCGPAWPPSVKENTSNFRSRTSGSDLRAQVKRHNTQPCGGKLHEGTPQAAQSCLSEEAPRGVGRGGRDVKREQVKGTKERGYCTVFWDAKLLPSSPFLYLLLYFSPSAASSPLAQDWFLEHSEITRKLRGRYGDFPYIPLPPHVDTDIVNQNGASLPRMKLHWHILIIQNPVYLMVP